ncbi:hypothetical protein HYV43_01815 [Candidatus Micrarchaeota archaeon]|nr:hypothetical protein [Candidatus Micrarchaeota archaeon]
MVDLPKVARLALQKIVWQELGETQKVVEIQARLDAEKAKLQQEKAKGGGA